MPSTYAPRTFGSLQKQFPVYFQEMGLDYPEETVLYFGVPDDGNPQAYPSVTVLPNWRANNRLVMGQAFGHHQARQPGSPEIIEVYEYHSYGAMVIDRDGEPTVDLIIAEPMDKILVPADCHMTLLNLGSDPLVTYDVANPAFHKNDKSLQRQLGPIISAWREGNTITLKLNLQYINHPACGVRLDSVPPDSELSIPLVVSGDTFGKEIYEQLSTEEVRRRFARLNIQLVPARTNSGQITKQIYGIEIYDPLVSLLHHPDRPLYFLLSSEREAEARKKKWREEEEAIKERWREQTKDWDQHDWYDWRHAGP